MVGEDRSNLMRSKPILKKRTGYIKQGGVGWCIQACRYSKVTIPNYDLWPFLLFSPNSNRSLAGGYSSFVRYIYISHVVFGTNRHDNNIAPPTTEKCPSSTSHFSPFDYCVCVVL